MNRYDFLDSLAEATRKTLALSANGLFQEIARDDNSGRGYLVQMYRNDIKTITLSALQGAGYIALVDSFDNPQKYGFGTRFADGFSKSKRAELTDRGREQARIMFPEIYQQQNNEGAKLELQA